MKAGRAVAVEPPIHAGMFDSSPAVVTVLGSHGERVRIVADARYASEIADAIEAEGLAAIDVMYEEWQVIA